MTNQNSIKMRKEAKILFIVLGVSAIVRGIYFFQISRTPFFPPLILDAGAYHQWAQDIMKNGWLGNEIFYQSPLYPYFLSIFYRLFGDANFIAPRILQSLLGISIPVLVYLISIRYFSRLVSLISAFIAVFYIPLFYEDPLGDKTALAICLTTLTMFLIVRLTGPAPTQWRGWQSNKLWVLAGMMIGITALVRENILLCAVAFIVFLSINKQWEKVAFMLVGMIFIITPITIRNYIVEKDFVLITSQAGENFYIGNNPDAPGTYKAPPFVRPQPKYEKVDFFTYAEKETGKSLKPSQVSNFYFSKSLQFIKQKPLQFIKLLCKKLLLFWNSYEVPDNYNYYFLQKFIPILRFPFITFSIISPLSILGLILSMKRWRDYIFLYLGIFSYMIGVVLFFIVGRYRVPIVPLLIPFASYAIVTILKEIKNKYYLIPAFVLLLMITNLPPSVFGIRYKDFGIDYYMLGYAYKEMGKLSEAVEAWEKTLQIAPNYKPAKFQIKTAKAMLRVIELQKEDQSDPKVLLELADVYKEADLLDSALLILRKACEIAPQNAEVHNKLGLYLAVLFDSLEQSLVHFEKARTIAPNSADIRASLGATYYKLGYTKKAFAEWEEALRLNPNNTVLKSTMEAIRQKSKH